MLAKMTRSIATIIVPTLFATSIALADDKDAVAETTAVTKSETVELNRIRARSATTAAVEDAIEAVLAENKLRLDIRLIGRTSVEMADGP